LMITANLSRFISLILGLKSFRNFINFKLLLRDSLTRKSLPCKLIGEESMKSLTPYLTKLVLLTLFPVPMLINRMEQQKENTDIWSKWYYLFWHKLKCHSSIGMKHLLRPPS
jgi:hypothetical protein